MREKIESEKKERWKDSIVFLFSYYVLYFFLARKFFLVCEIKRPVSSWSVLLSAFSLIAFVKLHCGFETADADKDLEV